MRPSHAPSRPRSLSNWILLFLLLLTTTTTADEIPPLAPGTPSVTSRTFNSISLTWSDLSNNETGFRIEFRTAGSPTPWSPGATTTANTTTSSVTGLNTNTNYEFRVLALNDTLVSPPSASVSTRTLSSPDEPAGEPYNLAVTRIFHNSITIAWSDNAANESGFRVLRALSAGGTTTAISLGANSTSYTDNSLAANTTYFYRVQAVNGTITGELSSQVSGRTLTAASAPVPASALTVSDITTNSARLTWNDNSTNEQTFTVERSTVPAGTWTTAGNVGFNVRSLVLNGLSASTAYSLRVRATNPTGSSFSNITTFSTPGIGGEFLNMATRHGNTYHLAFSSPSRLERYDLAAGASLPPIPLEATPTALWIDADGIFVAEGRKVVRFNLDGSARQSLVDLPSSVSLMFATDSVLVTSSALGRLTMFRKSTGTQLNTLDLSLSLHGLSYDPTLKRAFVQRPTFGDGDIYYIDVSDDGQLEVNERPESGFFPSASRTFVPPRGGRVFDSSGTIFSTDSLLQLGSLGAPFTDIAFLGPDVPVVLRGTRLHSYSRTMQEIGSTALTSAEPIRVAIHGNQAIVFAKDALNTSGFRIETVALSTIGAADPTQPINPRGLSYTADDIITTNDGVLWILSRAHLSLFRWSPEARDYLTTVPLKGAPNRIAYSPVNQRIYTAYSSNRIRMLDASAADPAEVEFAPFDGPVTGLAAAGSYLYASGGNPSGFSSYNSAGNVITAFYQWGTGRDNTWDPVRNRIYHLTEGSSPMSMTWKSVSADGSVERVLESSSSGIVTAPIRVRSDGERIALASGQIIQASNPTTATVIGNSVTDLLWIGNELASIRLLNGSTQLQRWLGPSLNVGPNPRQFAGSPVRLFATSTGYVVVTQLDGDPRFVLTDSDFNPVFLSPLRPAPPASLTSGARSTDSVELIWTDSPAAATGFQIEYRISGSGGLWIKGPTAAAGSTRTTVTGLTVNTLYDFRVRTLVGSMVSNPSATWSVSTLASPDQPLGEPYNLVATRVSHNSITISWKDNATNETGFRIIRTTNIGGPETVFLAAPNSTTYTSTGLTPNTSYFFRVQVNRGTTLGDLSTQIGVATLSFAQVPVSPSQLTATEVTSSRVTLSWRDNSTNEDNFALDRLSGSTWTTLQSFPFNTTSASITTLEPGIEHVLRIRAINTIGSTESHPLSVKPPALGGNFLDQSFRSGNVQYFAFDSPFRIERYDLTSRQWLTPVPTQAAASALWADDAGIYAAEDRNLVRWNLDGSGRQILTSRAIQISSIFTTGEIIGLYDDIIRTYHRRSGVALSSFPLYTGFSGPSVHPVNGRVFYRGPGSNPSTIHFFDLAPDGSSSASGSGPAFGGFASAFFTWVFPDGNRVIDESGTIYGTRFLSHVNRLSGNGFTDVAFHGGDLPIALRNNQVVSFRNNMLQSGAVTLTSPQPRKIALSSTDVLVFAISGASPNGMSIEVVPFAQLSVPEPGQIIDPIGLPYEPHDVFVDRDGALRILSRAHMSLFRWSPTERKYTGSQPLGAVPNWLTYDSSTNRLLFSDRGREIWQLAHNATTPDLFATLPGQVQGLAMAGDLVFASDPSGSRGTHYLYNAAGERLASRDWNHYSEYYTWDPNRRRMYFYSDQSPRDLHFETIGTDGQFGAVGESPYHGQFDFTGPIRTSSNGDLVMIGSGTIFRSSDIVASRDLGFRPVDMRWHAGQLITLENEALSVTRLQRWSTSFTRERSALVSGTPWRVVPSPDGGLVVVTEQPNGAPRFHLLNADLDVLSDSESATLSTTTVRAPASRRIDFGADTELEVLALGRLPLQYRWFRNGTEITGTTGSRLPITNAGSLSAGTYEVRVSDGTTEVIAGNIRVAVGPIIPAPIASGSLLLSGGALIREFPDPASSSIGQSITVPTSPGNSFGVPAKVSGVASDRLGRIHVLNHDHLGGSSVYLSTYDPGLQTWQHRALPRVGTMTNWSEGDLCLSGDWAVMNRGRIHSLTGEWRPFTGDWLPARVATGPGGVVFGMTAAGAVRSFNNTTESWGNPITLQASGSHQAFAVGTDGRFYTLLQGIYRSFQPDGRPIRSLSPATALTAQSLAVGGSGGLQLVAGSANAANFSLTQTALLSETRTSAQNPTTLPGYFVAWSSPVPEPKPAFVEPAAPPATEDIAWSWKPLVSHPDPDAVLTIEAVSIPPWMSFANGILSGTPAQANTGNTPVQLRVSDNSGRQTLWPLTLPVAEVNDAPIAVNRFLSGPEDSPSEAITLTDLISDEESATLTWNITGSTGSTISSEISGNRLLISYLPNAHGIATVRVRGTDDGFRFAESLITVRVYPVNDAPTGSLNPISANEDAAPITINLADSFTDIESPDLAFSAFSSRPDIAIAYANRSFLTLIPRPNANGTLTVTVRAIDPEGLSVSVPMAVTIIPVNDPPTGSLNPISANEDAAPITLNLADSFADIESPDSALTFSAISSRPDIASVSVIAGTLTLTPLPNANGTLTVTVRASDPEGLFVDVPMAVTVIPVNDTPTGSLEPISANEDAAPITLNLADSFADIESPDSALTFSALSSRPDIASATISGPLLTLTPLLNANGTLTVTVRATDPEGLFVDVPMAVTIIPVNDTPVIPAAIPDVAANDAGSDALIDFSPLVSDPDAGDVLTWRVIGNTNPALFSELSFDPQGRLTIRYAPYVSGEATITVSVSDSAGTVAQRSFKVVLPALPPPSVTTQGTLTLNRQTGLWEHRVTVRNVGQRPIGGFEIHVAGLPANASLYNASDCLTGLPCAIYHQPVAPGASVSMVLEYHVSDRHPLTAPTLTTFPTLPHDVSSPATSGALAIDVAMLLQPGMFMIEFPSDPGALYQIQYSDDGTRWLDSLSRIRAAGTRTQWIDQGSPRTASPPGSGTRFYRVKRLSAS